MDHDHRLHHLFYVLPSIGISAGGQFFVFFQMFFAYTSDIADVRGEESNKKFTRFLIAEVMFQVCIFLITILHQGSVYSGAVTGSYVGGMIYTRFGYTAVFMSAVGLMIGKSLGSGLALLLLTVDMSKPFLLFPVLKVA